MAELKTFTTEKKVEVTQTVEVKGIVLTEEEAWLLSDLLMDTVSWSHVETGLVEKGFPRYSLSNLYQVLLEARGSSDRPYNIDALQGHVKRRANDMLAEL